jgi:hypothetical protein
MSLSRRLLFSALLLTAGWLAVEAASWLAFWARDGKPFSYRRLAAERATLEADASGVSDDSDGDGGDGGGSADHSELTAAELAAAVRQAGGREVLHPFLGFVFNRELNRLERRHERGMLEIGPHGFFQPPPSWRADGRSLDPDDADFTVAFFGGSVSMVLSFAGRRPFLERLAELPETAGRRIAVDSFALGSFKQPQQLQALSYLLSQGERFDAVVNLDGFNELALPWAHGRGQQVYPAFPRDWAERTRRRPDPRRQRLAGEAAYLNHLRAAAAERWLDSPLRWSVAVNLLWSWRDRRWAVRAAAAERQLAALAAGERRFEQQGPSEPAVGDEQYLHRLADDWQRSSRLMAHLCDSLGIVYLHVLQPNQYVADSKPLSAAERRDAWRADHPYREPIARGYPLLIAAGAELSADGVQFRDASGLFRGLSETLYQDTCCHLNARGNERLARFVAEQLAPLLGEAKPPDSRSRDAAGDASQ